MNQVIPFDGDTDYVDGVFPDPWTYTIMEWINL